MRSLAAFGSGLMFSLGLVLAGMTQPANIVGFLDFFGNWKPALIFVMAGAVGVYALLYRIVLKRRSPLFAPSFDVPARDQVDAPLLVGSAAFGVGWGLGGFCPGPALVALGMGALQAVLFLAALLFGIVLYHFSSRNGPSGGEDNNACG
ncbi:MAG: hypothetical protein KCHDKBKB_01356 [Elusimicrobia bacterium]|nr:hypothetical protein [Elusimicrobiota bacterium]